MPCQMDNLGITLASSFRNSTGYITGAKAHSICRNLKFKLGTPPPANSPTLRADQSCNPQTHYFTVSESALTQQAGCVPQMDARNLAPCLDPKQECW